MLAELFSSTGGEGLPFTTCHEIYEPKYGAIYGARTRILQ
jgi:hypothetical protein